MKILFLFLSSLLVGCSGTFQKQPEIPAVPGITKAKIVIDYRIMEPCLPLKQLDGFEHSNVLDNIRDNVVIYQDCSNKQKSATEIIKKLTEDTK